ncbi:hypothetical protein J7295_03236 [Nakaseomyces glabratus]|nr:hypothetical protein J7298_03232 [Nakaseomyces glabratus]KAH7597778.1 hypothetical protein J7295_03236 [Nakaseomyces glabratus]KAH7612072.1 hypothetical protein J7292_03214 [Nakaseomyces glabratus]
MKNYIKSRINCSLFYNHLRLCVFGDFVLNIEISMGSYTHFEVLNPMLSVTPSVQVIYFQKFRFLLVFLFLFEVMRMLGTASVLLVERLLENLPMDLMDGGALNPHAPYMK